MELRTSQPLLIFHICLGDRLTLSNVFIAILNGRATTPMHVQVKW